MNITPELRADIAKLVKAASSCSQEDAENIAQQVTNLTGPLTYSRWRHGGWYVHP